MRRIEIYPFLDENEYIIRPANYHPSAPGRGMAIIDKGYIRIAVINLQGAVYLEPIRNPFDVMDEMIEKAKKENCKIIIVDFHAEATSEKRGMGYYVDGRVLGVSTEAAIQKMKTGLPVRFKNEDGPCSIEGCFFEIDNTTGKSIRTEAFRR